MCAGFLEPEFIAMAHRGGALLTANLGIENTLAAFTNSVARGYFIVSVFGCSLLLSNSTLDTTRCSIVINFLSTSDLNADSE